MKINPVVKVVGIHTFIMGIGAAAATVVYDLIKLSDSQKTIINYVAEQARSTK